MTKKMVFVELLAVIGGHDHERILEQPASIEFREQPPELVVEICDATVVRIAKELGCFLNDCGCIRGLVLLGHNRA